MVDPSDKIDIKENKHTGNASLSMRLRLPSFHKYLNGHGTLNKFLNSICMLLKLKKRDSQN